MSDIAVYINHKFLEAMELPRLSIYYDVVERYFKSYSSGILGIIFGLINTGKKTCLRQLASDLPNSALIHISGDSDKNLIVNICLDLMNKGINNFFIENISSFPEICSITLNFCREYSDGKFKFVFTGDENYIFHLLNTTELLFSLRFFYTDHIFCKIDDNYIQNAIFNNLIFALKSGKSNDLEFPILYKMYEQNQFYYDIKSMLFQKNNFDDKNISCEILNHLGVLYYKNNKFEYRYSELENFAMDLDDFDMFESKKFIIDIFPQATKDHIDFLAYRFIHDFLLETNQDFKINLNLDPKITPFELAKICYKHYNSIKDNYHINITNLIEKYNLSSLKNAILKENNLKPISENNLLEALEIWSLNYISQNLGSDNFTYREWYKIVECISNYIRKMKKDIILNHLAEDLSILCDILKRNRLQKIDIVVNYGL